jgi:hypothetical protein
MALMGQFLLSLFAIASAAKQSRPAHMRLRLEIASLRAQ